MRFLSHICVMPFVDGKRFNQKAYLRQTKTNG